MRPRKSANKSGEEVKSRCCRLSVRACVRACVCVCVRATGPPTVGGELVLLEHGDAQDVLVEVPDEELAVEVPLGVERVAERPGRVALGPHGELAVRVAFT